MSEPMNYSRSVKFQTEELPFISIRSNSEEMQSLKNSKLKTSINNHVITWPREVLINTGIK